MTLRSFILIIALVFCASPLPVWAANDSAQRSLGTFGHWQAYTFREHDQPVCYMALAVPVQKNGKIKRSDARLMITHRPADASKDVVSYIAGYNFKPASVADAQIGKTLFNLFTAKDTAWTRDAGSDRALAAAIRNGKTMTVTGFPAAQPKGVTTLTDKFDLTGAAKAYTAISHACGYPDERKTPAPAKTAKTAPKTAKKTHGK